MHSFENQVALVTGAGRGIGKAIAISLAKQGADLILVNRNAEQAQEVCAEIEALGRRCHHFQVDVADFDAVQDMSQKALEHFDRIDCIVNNAGMTKDNLLLRMTPEEWQRVVDVNLTGMFHVTRAFVRKMVKQRYGRIVNVGSVVGSSGNPGQANYSATKAGMIGFTKSIARELGTRNITCNLVAPGYVATDMTDRLTEAQSQMIIDQVPLGRIAEAEEIANAVSFLLSKEASYITGTVLHVNGGLY